MTTASIPRHAKPVSRLAWAAGLVRLAVFLLTHPRAPLPSGLLNVRVPAGPRGIQLIGLEDVASAYRTRTEQRHGWQVAERSFGPLTIEAHVKDPDYTTQLFAPVPAGNEAAA